MTRLLTTFAAAAALALAAGSAANAQYAEPQAQSPAPHTNDRIAPQAKNNAVGSARLLLLAGQGGAIVRSLNVDTVTSPVAGEYCIKPKKAIDATTAVPMTAVEWSNSAGDGGVAEWRSSGAGCPAGTIDILTYVIDPAGSSSLTPSATVAFTVVIP
jgi:hypothetical protein